ARRVVEDLPGDGVELDAGGEAGDGADVDGQEVEEQGAVGLGLQRHHLAAGVFRGARVDVLEVGGLAAEAGAVVHDLGSHLHGAVIEEDHASLRAPARVDLGDYTRSRRGSRKLGCAQISRNAERSASCDWLNGSRAASWRSPSRASKT